MVKEVEPLGDTGNAKINQIKLNKIKWHNSEAQS